MDVMRRLHGLPDGGKNALAGACAGMLSSVVVCPLDVVKINLQNAGVDAPRQLGGTWNALKVIWRTERLRGLYRGLSPTLAAYLPSWGIYFGVYDGVKRALIQETTAAPTAHLLAALVGGCASTVAATPLWVIRTRIMTQTKAGPPPAPPPTPYFYHGIWDASKTIYRKEGPRAFYKGLAPSLLGVTHVVVQFPLYEHFKVYFSENLTSSQTPLGHDNTIQPSGILKSHSLSPLVLVLSSSISKTIASLLTYPHEVIRTRLQTQTSNTLHPCLYPISSPSNPGTTTTAASNVTPRKLYRGILGTARRILKEEGTHGLYKGFGTNLVRTVPSSVITLCTFELVRRELG